MGYITSFSLSLIRGDKKEFNSMLCELAEEINNDDIKEGFISAKWYSFDEDIKKSSEKHPNLLVKILGRGEDIDDIWCAYAHHGAVEILSLSKAIEPLTRKILEEYEEYEKS